MIYDPDCIEFNINIREGSSQSGDGRDRKIHKFPSV